jgi:hypothetical protein
VHQIALCVWALPSSSDSPVPLPRMCMCSCAPQIATAMQALGGVLGYLTAFLVFRRDCNQTCTEKTSTAFNVRSQRLL